MYHADSHQPQTQSTEQTPSSVASLPSIGTSYSSELQSCAVQLEVLARVVEMLASTSVMHSGSEKMDGIM